MAGGRPLKFTCPKELERSIQYYFEVEAWVENKEGEKEYLPTFSGLAYHLDICTETLRNYQEKPEFFGPIKRAKQRIEVSLEQRLAGNAVTGTIFNLKNNFGWKDKSEQELTGANGGAIKTESTVEWVIQPVKPVDETDS